MSARDEFLAGERPDDVALYIAEDTVDDPETLATLGTAEEVAGGVVLVVPGKRGRAAVSRVTGRDAMSFAREAGATRTRVDRDLAGGDCPDADTAEGPHHPTLVFAFVEARNEEVGGLYAEGAVVHAYAACACGASYSERWVAGQRT